MRLGGQDVKLTPGTLAHWLFGQDAVRERFRHRYEVEPDHIERFESQGLIFSGRHPDRPIMQMLELPLDQHPFFFAAQSHPELTSRPLTPQPMFMGLLSAAIRHAYPSLALQGSPFTVARCRINNWYSRFNDAAATLIVRSAT